MGLLVGVEGGRRGETLVALGALVVPHPQVGTLLVDGFRPVLGERLLTEPALVPGQLAVSLPHKQHLRPLSGVGPLVYLKSGLLGKLLVAMLAVERLLTRVAALV